MPSVLNVATPATAVTEAVPESVPPPALLRIPTAIAAVKSAATLLEASSAVTVKLPIVAPATVLPGWLENTRCVATLLMTLNPALVPLVSPVAVAASVYPVPTLLMLRVANVATPAVAATVAVPESVPPPALVPIATVTVLVKVRSVLPSPSCAATWTPPDELIVAAASELVGWLVNVSLVAAPAMIVKPLLVAPVRPVAAAARVYPVPLLLMLMVENEATPATALADTVPPSVPPPALVPKSSVTEPVKPVAVLPFASRAVTAIAGAIVAPAVALVGCPVNTSCVAAPGTMLNVALANPPTSPVAVADSVYPVPVLSMLNVENVAVPFTATTVLVPERFAPAAPVLPVIAIVIALAKLVA